MTETEKLNKVTRIIRNIVEEMGWSHMWGGVESFIVDNQVRLLRLYDSIQEIMTDG